MMGLTEANAWLLNEYTDEVNRNKTMLKVVCAWCDKPMGTKDGQGQSGVTHGICKECAEKVRGGD